MVLYLKKVFIVTILIVIPFCASASDVNGVFFKDGINWMAKSENAKANMVALLGHNQSSLHSDGYPFLISFVFAGKMPTKKAVTSNTTDLLRLDLSIDGKTYSVLGRPEQFGDNFYNYVVDPYLSSFDELDKAMRAGNRLFIPNLHDDKTTIYSLSGYTKTSNSFYSDDAEQQSSSNVASTQADWVVFMEESPKECWAASQPVEMVTLKNGKFTAYRRADILLFVSYIPGSGIKEQISFTGGYMFADGSNVDVNIDGASYQMFTNGEWAWTPTVKVDQKMVQALKRGKKAVFTARSKDGIKSIDTFSLKGFTAAVLDAAKRCN